VDHQIGEAGAANDRPDLVGGWICKDNRYAQVESTVDRYGFKNGDATIKKGNTRGQYERVALVSDGSVRCWGTDDDKRISSTPTTGLFAEVEAGIRHTCALREDGSIICWGRNSEGQTWPRYSTLRRDVGRLCLCLIQPALKRYSFHT